MARAFRADEALRSTYLIALTGYAQAEDLGAASNAGFDEHLAKPANMEGIKRVLAGSLTRARRPELHLIANTVSMTGESLVVFSVHDRQQGISQLGCTVRGGWGGRETRAGFLRSVLARALRFEALEAELRTSEGKRFWAQVSAALVEHDGQPSLLVGATDISAGERAGGGAPPQRDHAAHPAGGGPQPAGGHLPRGRRAPLLQRAGGRAVRAVLRGGGGAAGARLYFRSRRSPGVRRAPPPRGAGRPGSRPGSAPAAGAPSGR